MRYAEACYCDFDETWSVYRATLVASARKAHRCYECHRTISPGDRYESAFGVIAGDSHNMPTCATCLDLLDWITAHVPCFGACRMHGALLTQARTFLGETQGEESYGFRFGAWRRYIKAMRRRKA